MRSLISFEAIFGTLFFDATLYFWPSVKLLLSAPALVRLEVMVFDYGSSTAKSSPALTCERTLYLLVTAFLISERSILP